VALLGLLVTSSPAFAPDAFFYRIVRKTKGRSGSAHQWIWLHNGGRMPDKQRLPDDARNWAPNDV
jgi:hypothetical protein